ncbi:MAG: type I restriction enzyme HsdR N-terminal domain-containing protein [Bacteroides sp.]|nr:type I restriction enzyme HsdR N-terminal domain-containing protein [Bacteroides sp.]MCM1379848.1 type I restriction enzyme HsdR N-terminal domain-containing protein [Bacteroides sp.]MCM1446120.1 type I restriction enzyme HsdR N-terminal domain-containing protein [Prevotella sp.]
MPATDQKNCITPLKLPPRELPLRRNQRGLIEIFDPLRHKWLILTPEEWVRQHFTAHLISDRSYPASLIANEITVNLNGLKRRCDSVVWSSADGSPLMIIEYKAPEVALTRKVFDQIVRYNMVLQTPYLIVSNGLKHYCCKVDCAKGTYSFLPEIPDYLKL